MEIGIVYPKMAKSIGGRFHFSFRIAFGGHRISLVASLTCLAYVHYVYLLEQQEHQQEQRGNNSDNWTASQKRMERMYLEEMAMAP
jgi:hypothetical protein